MALLLLLVSGVQAHKFPVFCFDFGISTKKVAVDPNTLDEPCCESWSALQKDTATMVIPHYLLAGFGVTWKHDPGCAMRAFPERLN